MTICSFGGGYLPQHSACFRIRPFLRTLRSCRPVSGLSASWKKRASLVSLGYLAFAHWPCGSRNLQWRLVLTYAKINLECLAMQRSVFAMTVLMGAVSWGGCRADPEAAASVRDTAE